MGFLNDLADYIWEPTCLICHNPVDSSSAGICPICYALLPRTNYHRESDNPMIQKFAELPNLVEATGLFFYSRNSEVAHLLHNLKYHRFPSIGTYLGQQTASELYTTGFFNGLDALVPVGMHWWSRIKRGYDQVQLFAEGISSITGIPVVKALGLSKFHRSQTKRTYQDRRKAMLDKFILLPEANTLANKHILLLDDICTTGGTLLGAAQTLGKITCIKSDILTIAVAL